MYFTCISCAINIHGHGYTLITNSRANERKNGVSLVAVDKTSKKQKNCKIKCLTFFYAQIFIN